MRPTAAEAEWAMRAVVIDRLGDDAGAVAIEAQPPRPGDPPNIRRLRTSGPGDVMGTLDRSISPIVDGLTPPLGIIARMPLAVLARAAATVEPTEPAMQRRALG